MHGLDQTASLNFQTYLNNYRGVNYIKDTFLNLAWLELLKGNIRGYKSLTEQVRLKGYSYHDKDKQALKEANDPVPDQNLLRARLLFDGTYYDKALAQIADRKMEDFKILRDKIEYCYRLGRIYNEVSRDDFALKFYQLPLIWEKMSVIILLPMRPSE